MLQKRMLNLFFSGFFMLSGTVVMASEAVNPDDIAKSRMIVKEFGKTLKGELMAAVKAGGPANGIQICNTRAVDIANEMSGKHGMTVGRTSLKLRNPSNTPDAWEQKVLADFEKRKAAGESPKQMEYSEIVSEKGKKEFRYMKAIGIGKACLNCHAAEVKPVVAEKLKELYPTDKARGYQLGDIRGAFTLRKDL